MMDASQAYDIRMAEEIERYDRYTALDLRNHMEMLLLHDRPFLPISLRAFLFVLYERLREYDRSFVDKG